MCTAIGFSNDGKLFFGRNLDLDHGFGEKVVFMPRNYQIVFREPCLSTSQLAADCFTASNCLSEPAKNHKTNLSESGFMSPTSDVPALSDAATTSLTNTISRHYAVLGMASVIDNYPLYADAVNEKGLCAANINFPGFAQYGTDTDAARVLKVASFEIMNWILAQFSSVAQLRPALEQLCITSQQFSPQIPTAPLHWIVSDAYESIVLECDRQGLKVFDNPFGVITNSPGFDFHQQNLRLYLNLRAGEPTNSFLPSLELTPPGVGCGIMGIPGDSSPASRFVRAAFMRAAAQEGNTVTSSNRSSDTTVTDKENLNQLAHMLGAVAMVRGTTLNQHGDLEYTVYTSAIDAANGTYYYRYYNDLLTGYRHSSLKDYDLDASSLTV